MDIGVGVAVGACGQERIGRHKYICRTVSVVEDQTRIGGLKSEQNHIGGF